jgi:hypothetical protein
VSDTEVQITYIAGLGRSGTTVLDQLLGSRSGFFSAGELMFIWRNGVLLDWTCACGTPFSSCPFWDRVRLTDPSLLTSQTATEVVKDQQQAIRNRLMYRVWWAGGRQRAVRDMPRRYFDRLGRLYKAIWMANGGLNIVDSSKDPIYAHLLIESGAAATVDLIHMVRDPRAVAYSRMQRMLDPTSPGANEYLGSKPPALSAALWVEWNATIERMGRVLPIHYRLLRYEDFVKDPESCLRHLALRRSSDSKILPETIQNDRVWHTVYGNPSRLRRGPIVVQPDLRWLQGMSKGDVRTVNLITAPLLRRYGYPFRPRTGGTSLANV